jgi:hypothetical protein
VRRALAKEQRQEDGHYERHLAGEIIAMLPVAPDEAWRVLAIVDAMLNVKLPPREPQLPDAA